MVEAAADAVGPTALTAADVRMIIAEVVKAHPRRNWRTDVALVVAIGALILQWLCYQQDRAEYARTDPPPNITVIVERPDPAEIERIVDERLRERNAEHADYDPGSRSHQPDR